MPQNPLEQIIRERIASQGPMPFEAFMDLALYHPDDGYYMSGHIPIGLEGDFYTASHLHPMFGWLLAVQLDEIRRSMGAPQEFTILEVGAGKGYLAEAIIDFILRRLAWKDGWRYIIVERNQSAVAVQREVLDRYAGLLDWKASLDEVGPFCGCVFSNELIDAFPVHLLQMGDRPREIFVTVGGRGFQETEGEPSRDQLRAFLERYGVPKAAGYRTEVNLRIEDYLMRVSRVLEEGYVVTIDYGFSAREYYAPERSAGTLLSYAGHGISENPLVDPGRRDITAHVNFTSLRDWGVPCGLQTVGYCSQGAFLASLGIDELVTRELEKDPRFQNDLLRIKSLLFGMGDSHQVLVQSKGRRDAGMLRGFALSNRRSRL